MKNVRQRYESDPAFRTLVDTLYMCIERAEFTPTEIREAAMLAQIHYESVHIRPHVFTRQQVEAMDPEPIVPWSEPQGKPEGGK